LLPAGFFLLNREGANLSIKAVIDRDANFQKWQATDQALGVMADKLSLMSTKYNYQVDLNLRKDETIKELSRSLRNDKFWKYTGIGAASMLAIVLIMKK